MQQYIHASTLDLEWCKTLMPGASRLAFGKAEDNVHLVNALLEALEADGHSTAYSTIDEKAMRQILVQNRRNEHNAKKRAVGESFPDFNPETVPVLPSGNYLRSVCWSPSTMRETWREFPEIMAVDGTFCATEQGLTLISAYTLTSNTECACLGHCLTIMNESVATWTEFFQFP